MVNAFLNLSELRCWVFFGLGCVAAVRIAGAELGLWEISIIWGLGVALAVYLTAGTSGAHLNPCCYRCVLAICLLRTQKSCSYYCTNVRWLLCRSHCNIFVLRCFLLLNKLMALIGAHKKVLHCRCILTYPAAQFPLHMPLLSKLSLPLSLLA